MCIEERFCKCHIFEQREKEFWERVANKLKKNKTRRVFVDGILHEITLKPIGENE